MSKIRLIRSEEIGNFHLIRRASHLSQCSTDEQKPHSTMQNRTNTTIERFHPPPKAVGKNEPYGWARSVGLEAFSLITLPGEAIKAKAFTTQTSEPSLAGIVNGKGANPTTSYPSIPCQNHACAGIVAGPSSSGGGWITLTLDAAFTAIRCWYSTLTACPVPAPEVRRF